MRRSQFEVAVLAAILLIEATMYSVLVPLLPELTHTLQLSKSASGVLYSTYMVASLCGAIVGRNVVYRFGVRRANQISLVVLGLSGIGFALADTYATAVAFRAVAGIAGGVAWVAAMAQLFATAPASQRGESVGTAMGVAIFGTLLGPLVGNAAISLGRLQVFAAVAMVCLMCAAIVPREPAPSAETVTTLTPPSPGRLERRVLVGSVWVLGLTAFTYGTLFVLFPLRLSTGGVPALWIGWIFAISSLLAAVVSHVAGKMMNRAGAARMTAVSLVATSVALIAFALADDPVTHVVLIVVVIGLVLALGVTPNAAVLSLDADRAGTAQRTTSMILIVVFSGGEGIGGIIGPTAAQHLSDRTVLMSLAAVLTASVGIVTVCHRARKGRLAQLSSGLSGDCEASIRNT